VRGEQTVNPAGRAASPRNGGNDLREHVEAVLQPPVGARLHDAEKIRLPHAFDHVVADAAIGFGLLRALARELGDGMRPRQKIGPIGDGDWGPCGTDCHPNEARLEGDRLSCRDPPMQVWPPQAAARRRQKALLRPKAKPQIGLASDSDRGNAVDLHVERTVPGRHADEAARRRVRWKLQRVDRIDRLEMRRVGASAAANLVELAALVGDTARATILAALMGGQALTGSELAYLARVSRPTASEHLLKLVEARLVAVTKQGRYRYYRIASPLVARMLESIIAVAAIEVPS